MYASKRFICFVFFFYFKGTIQSNTFINACDLINGGWKRHDSFPHVINACDLINGGWKRHDSFPRVIIASNQSIDLRYIRVG